MHEAQKSAARVDKDYMEQDLLSQARKSHTASDGGRTRTMLLIAGAAFLLGASLTGYLAWRGEFPFPVAEREQLGVVGAVTPRPADISAEPTPSPSASGAQQAAEAVQAVEIVAHQQGGLDARVVAMEQRIDQLNLQAQAAMGNAARAEGLLIAFAARRAIERGEPLGYLADQLKLRFEDARPNSVQTILAAAENPVTLDQLIARLEGLAPMLAKGADHQVSWARLMDELSNLFVIRRETSPSPQPERRLDRARLFLESGRIEAAVAEVRNLPGADEAQQWIADAERYAAAQRALDRLETAAILEPRELRDGSGRRVQQPSPAGAPAN